MAEENQNKSHEYTTSEVEVKDRGVFDFLGKKKEEEKPQKEEEEVIVPEFDKLKVSDEPETKPEEHEHVSLSEMLQRSNSSSSSVCFLFYC